jgi:hypothetical protein
MESIFVTRKSGGPYPDGEIQHTYSNPGNYLVGIDYELGWRFPWCKELKARIPGRN